MVWGKSFLRYALLLISAGNLLHAEKEQSTNNANIYSELYRIFASQLTQNNSANNAITGPASIGNTQKPTLATLEISAAEKKRAWLLCIYCDICAQREAASKNPIIQSIPVSTLEKLGIIPAGKVSFNCTVLKKLSIPEGTIFGEAERAALLMQSPTFSELQNNQMVTRYFAENSDARKRALHAIEKIRSAQNDFLSLFLINEQKNDRLENYYWSMGALKKLNNSSLGLAVSDGFEQLFKTLAGVLPPCAYLSAFSGFYKGISLLGKNRFNNTAANLFANLAYIPVATVQGLGEGLWGEIIAHWPGTYSYNATSDDKTVTLQNVGSFPYTSFGDRWSHLFANTCQENGAAEFNTAFSIANMPGISSFKTLDASQTKVIKEGIKTFPLSPWRGPKLAFTTALLGLAWRDALNIMNMRATYKKIQEDFAAFKLVQAQLMGIARLLDGMAQLCKIAEDSHIVPLKALGRELIVFENLRKKNEDFARLCALLKTNTFKGEPSVLSNRTRILLAHRLLRKCKCLFLSALQHSVGKIELFVSAAEFYAKHRTTGKPVCLVDFVNEPQPRLELENCWNIQVDEKDAVCFSIQFGKNGSQHAIFSGPNGTGKSTNETAIAHSLFMSKLGIACASNAVMTPFEVFAIHRNEQENIELGDSSFMAQKAHFDTICAEIAALVDKRMFIIMDEPLNGTVEEAAGRIIYEKCKELLANQKQAICIIATHAKQPTELEANTNGAFANYYVKVLELAPTEFKRTFELERGIPVWWFDDADRRSRFIEWLSQKNPTVADPNTDIKK